MQHVIMEQVLDLRVDSRLDSFRVQQQFSVLYKDEMQALLGKLFDEIAGEYEMIAVEKLELDLGRYGEEELSRRTTTEKILAAISSQVREKLRKALIYGDPEIKAGRESQGIFRQWLFYMRKGYLPWNTVITSGAWYRQVLEATATDSSAVQELKRLINNEPRALERIVLGHSPDFLTHLVEIITAEKQDNLQMFIPELNMAILALMQQEELDTVHQTTAGHSIWKHILQLVAAPDTMQVMTATVIMREVLLHVFSAEQVMALAANTPFLKKLNVTTEVWEKINTALPARENQKSKNKEQDPVNTPARENKRNKGNNNQQEGQIPAATGLLKEVAISRPPVTARQNDAEQPDTGHTGSSGIFLRLAGLVILHPFLRAFFRNMGLVNENEFVHLHAQQQAIQLLHYMATGSAAREEHELVLPKLLCGYPPDEPFDCAVLPDAHQLEGAGELLDEVIAQWEIVNGSSREALQESFFQREGILTVTDNRNRLQVERRSYDMLLDRLPWSISYIQLPWMNQLLLVEWAK